MFIKSSYTNLSGNRKAFTLLEVLIAVFILATVLSTVYAAYRGTFQITGDSEEDREIYGAAKSTMERILKDLGALSMSRGKFRFVARPSEIAGPNFIDLTFISRAHLAFAENEIPSGLAEIAYYVDEDESQEGYRLMRRDALYDGSDERQQSHRGFVLCERLHSLTYKFIDAAANEHDYWDSEAGPDGEKNKAPGMVSIELKLINKKDKDRPYTFATKVFLPLSTVVSSSPP